MKIGKYEFLTKEQAQEKIDALGIETDENGNEYPTHNNTIVELGYIVLEQGEYDEAGLELVPPILSDKYSVDVLWSTDKEPYGWKSYRLNLDGDGVHSFLGLHYNDYKFD